MEVVELDAAGIDAHSDDLAQLLLDAHASNMALGLSGPLTKERAADAWNELRGTILAALEDGRVVGALCLTRARENGTHRAEVQKLVVRMDARGRGIGTRLLAAAEDRARELGVSLLWLTTHVGTQADGYYERLGWTRYGVVPGWARLPDGSLADNAFFYRVLT
jgi:GNAT superfamily N-acetyltransferase